MQGKYLPIGTVCLLKNARKKVMVVGFCATATEVGDKVFDYIGCLYPEGVVSSNENLLFDHEQIDKIYYLGYSDEEDKTFKEKLKELLEKVDLNNIESLDDNINNSSSIYDMNIPSATIVPEDNSNI